MCYMRSRYTLLVMNVQVELKTGILVKLKVRLFCGFYHRFMQYQFSDADSDFFIMGGSLCQRL